jgi:hypothetical protein
MAGIAELFCAANHARGDLKKRDRCVWLHSSPSTYSREGTDSAARYMTMSGGTESSVTAITFGRIQFIRLSSGVIRQKRAAARGDRAAAFYVRT